MKPYGWVDTPPKKGALKAYCMGGLFRESTLLY